jgi:four helix bundle protein
MHLLERMEKPHDIQERSFLFSCRLIDFCRPIFSGHPIVQHLARQLLDSGTSVGANLDEADAGHTKPDFRNKISIARKECREARYWLRLTAYADSRLDAIAQPLIIEATEITNILTAIKCNSERNENRG